MCVRVCVYIYIYKKSRIDSRERWAFLLGEFEYMEESNRVSQCEN